MIAIFARATEPRDGHQSHDQPDVLWTPFLLILRPGGDDGQRHFQRRLQARRGRSDHRTVLPGQRGFRTARGEQTLALCLEAQVREGGAGGTEKDAGIRRLKRELARVSEERGILKKPPRISLGMHSEWSHWSAIGSSPMATAFVAGHRGQFSVRAMCRCLRVRSSGFCAWLTAPERASTGRPRPD